MNKIEIKPAPCNFDDKAHSYTAKKDGKLWPGTTTISGLLEKPFLMPWAAKECAEAVKRSREILLATKDRVQFDAIVDECKMSYRRKSTDALTSGSTAHDWIENHIKAQIEGRWTENRVDEIEDKTAVSAIFAFLDWEKSHNITWLASELVVGSEAHEFGGKLDALADIDGVITLVDFKTSNQISKEYALQLAGYQLALSEMGQEVDERLIVRIPKDGAGFETWKVPTPYDLDMSAFLGLRQVQRWKSYMENEERGIVGYMGKVKVDEKQKVTNKK